jgi:hypothetical protein
MIFSLTGYVHEQFSFIIKLIKKKKIVINPNKNQPLLIQFDQTIRTKCHTTYLISYIPWSIEFNEITKNMISSQPLTAWTDWFVTRNGENIRRVVWHHHLVVWSNLIRHTRCLIVYFFCLRWHSTWRNLLTTIQFYCQINKKKKQFRKKF